MTNTKKENLQSILPALTPTHTPRKKKKKKNHQGHHKQGTSKKPSQSAEPEGDMGTMYIVGAWTRSWDRKETWNLNGIRALANMFHF